MTNFFVQPKIFQSNARLKPLKKSMVLILSVSAFLGQTAVANEPSQKLVKLNPELTQAMVSANPNIAVPIQSINQTPTDIPQTAPTDMGVDDGGEVDIPDGYPISDGVPIAEGDNALTPPADTQTPATNVNLDKLAEENPDIGQTLNVPLGAISPTTVAKFVKTIDIVRQEYVENVDDERLFANAISGALTSLDPYSEYLDSEAFENLRLFTEGDIGSIGVQVSFHPSERMWVFDEVIANSPAAQQGVQTGYYLHQINDNKLNEEQTQQDINQLLSGIAGTQLKLTVSDKGRRKQTITVQRSLVEQQSIQAKIEKGVAIVQIPVFQNNTQQQILTAISALNQPFNAIILDLRNNPGGVLSSANDVASLFMSKKTLVQVKNRQGLQEIMQTYAHSRLPNVPLAVIQNRYSASAAEVLASSLKENNRAKIYGETSYGKGSIQSIVPINDNEAVKLTVAHYYSGKGEKIDGVGVKADEILTSSEKDWEEQVLQSVLQQPRPIFYQLDTPHNIQAY